MASVLFQMRIDESLKDKATKLYDEIGIDLPTAIRMFLKKSIAERGIPFSTTVRNDKGISLLKELSDNSKRNGLDKLTMEDIDDEISEYRKGKKK